MEIAELCQPIPGAESGAPNTSLPAMFTGSLDGVTLYRNLSEVTANQSLIEDSMAGFMVGGNDDNGLNNHSDGARVPENLNPTMAFIRFFVKNILVPLICGFGIIGNSLSLLILTRKRLKSSCDGPERTINLGLIALALSDLIICVCLLPHGLIRGEKFFYKSLSFDLLYRAYGEAVSNTFMLMSTWLTVTMAFSRYLAIVRPFQARPLIGITGTKTSIVVVFISSVLFNIPRFFQWYSDSIPCAAGSKLYFRSPGALQSSDNVARKQAWIWAYFCLGIMAPLALLAFCNICLGKALRESSKLRRRYRVPAAHVDSNHRITSILVAIVVMYIVLVSPSEIFRFIQSFLIQKQFHLRDSEVLSTINEVTNLLQTINYSCDFVLYFILNIHFRQTLLEMFRCCGKKQRRKFAEQSVKDRTQSIRLTTHHNSLRTPAFSLASV